MTALPAAVAMHTELSTQLSAARSGDRDAFARAYAAAYDELRRLARRQLRAMRPGDTLATTALVNEAFLKLVRHPVGCADRHHFFALAARAMRQILVDYARERQSRKRGGGLRQTTLDAENLSVEAIAAEMIDIDAALTRLASVDEWLGRLVEWRFFGGMTEEEIAEAEGIATRTVRRDWQKARAFLYGELRRRD
jgi:RNA polymerase sigma factor (TIGR02999 family)